MIYFAQLVVLCACAKFGNHYMLLRGTPIYWRSWKTIVHARVVYFLKYCIYLWFESDGQTFFNLFPRDESFHYGLNTTVWTHLFTLVSSICSPFMVPPTDPWCACSFMPRPSVHTVPHRPFFAQTSAPHSVVFAAPSRPCHAQSSVVPPVVSAVPSRLCWTPVTLLS